MTPTIYTGRATTEIFKSLHGLEFEAAKWHPELWNGEMNGYMVFRIGTCEGLWVSSKTTYDIIAVSNNEIGNGHFEDVLQYFERSCRRDKKNFRFLEIMNPRLMKHLIEKRGFRRESLNNAIKSWRKCNPGF